MRQVHVAPEEVYLFDAYLGGNTRNPYQMAECCRAVIESDSDQPFFLYFATSDPHRGCGFARELDHAPDRFGNPAPGPRNSYEGIEEVIYDPADVPVPRFLPDTPACRAELAQYYQSQARIDQGVGHLFEILKDAGRWDETLIVFISDHGMAFAGAKTTVYDGGLRCPLIVRDPYTETRGTQPDAMISWIDLTPTLLDFAGVLNDDGAVRQDILDAITIERVTGQRTNDVGPGSLHGRSFMATLGQTETTGWDEIGASHTFHEIQMYYPMRVVQDRRYKLIWNIAHAQPFPFTSDLWASPTWQRQFEQGDDAPYGARTVGEYVQRPEFELYDLTADPFEATTSPTTRATPR